MFPTIPTNTWPSGRCSYLSISLGSYYSCLYRVRHQPSLPSPLLITCSLQTPFDFQKNGGEAVINASHRQILNLLWGSRLFGFLSPYILTRDGTEQGDPRDLLQAGAEVALHCESPKKVRILSIDGGGYSPIVAGSSLVHLEHQIRLRTGDSSARIADFFDIFTGTGMGAILAAMLVAHDGSGRPLFPASDAVNLLSQTNSKMFKLRLAGALPWRRAFSGKCMDKALKELFKSEDGKALTLKDTSKPLLVPCFDLKSSGPFVFSRADALGSPSFNFELWKVCRASSATPSLFKPYDLTSIDGKTSCTAIDGGLVMNNPTAAAITHVLHNKRDFPSVNGVEDLLVLSLSNGPSTASMGRKFGRNGECSTSSVVDIALDGVSETIDQMLGNAFSWNREDYVRIQANDGKGRGRVEEDTLKERGLESLAFGGKRMAKETNGERIESLARRLVCSGRSSLPPSPCSYPAVTPLAHGR